ncbi:hypothetical protein, partial [Acidihalobacter prosperus]
PPPDVARRSFGTTKLLSSRLDWRSTGRNSTSRNSVNRPQGLLTLLRDALPELLFAACKALRA